MAAKRVGNSARERWVVRCIDDDQCYTDPRRWWRHLARAGNARGATQVPWLLIACELGQLHNHICALVRQSLVALIS